MLLSMTLAVQAQRIAVHAPSRVAAGENFRLEYTVNTSNADNIRLGNIPDEFEVVFGPSVSQQESYTIVNGHATSSSSTTYTYTLMGTKSGSFVLQNSIKTKMTNLKCSLLAHLYQTRTFS